SLFVFVLAALANLADDRLDVLRRQNDRFDHFQYALDTKIAGRVAGAAHDYDADRLTGAVGHRRAQALNARENLRHHERPRLLDDSLDPADGDGDLPVQRFPQPVDEH